MEEATQPIKKKRKTLLITGIVGICLVALAAGYYFWHKSTQIIPPGIKKQISISVAWPSENSLAKGDKSTIKYNSQDKLLSYVAHLSDGNKLTISEQPTPESFIDIPDAYTKLISSMQQYKAFDTPNGKVYLTRPKSLNGGQTAVSNRQGILLFARPDKDISDDVWTQIFNNLDQLK